MERKMITTNAIASDAPQVGGWAKRTPPVAGARKDAASEEARRAAREVDQGARRREATPVRRTFVRGIQSESLASPMLALYRGGRSGAVPIRLYLAILWKCSKAPFETQAPARSWATMLDLPDPAHAGARRVRAALAKLQEHRLITADEPAPGELTKVTLLREDGTGHKYSSPSGAYMRAASQKRGKKVLEQHEYLRINNELWTTGHMQAMDGPALAMLLILMAEGGDRGRPVWMSSRWFDERYGLSPTTRSKGVKELVERELVMVNRQSVPDHPGASVFQRQRYRDVYMLQGPAVAPKDPGSEVVR